MYSLKLEAGDGNGESRGLDSGDAGADEGAGGREHHVQAGCHIAHTGDHAEGDSREDQAVLDQILAFLANDQITEKEIQGSLKLVHDAPRALRQLDDCAWGAEGRQSSVRNLCGINGNLIFIHRSGSVGRRADVDQRVIQRGEDGLDSTSPGG